MFNKRRVGNYLCVCTLDGEDTHSTIGCVVFVISLSVTGKRVDTIVLLIYRTNLPRSLSVTPCKRVKKKDVT